MEIMKKLFIIICLLANIVVLGACGDVESAGEPQPRVPRVEVESENYYVQIVQENIDGVAFVYRWLDMDTASKYVITLEYEGTTETLEIEDKSILTYDGVRELLFTNRQIMEYMRTFGLDGKEAQLSITLEAFQADGTPITSETAKASKTSKINIILGPGVELNPDLE
ncbi:hypothetical protein [Bacteroides congonensis]|uniref:hypothetical protein n=1 Tax=Bacteroides TaxID=816 RepID=UPI0018991212|nr:hypothetical protein [Bacteroides congonensis]